MQAKNIKATYNGVYAEWRAIAENMHTNIHGYEDK